MATIAAPIPPMVPIEQDRWLTTAEAGAYLGISPDSLASYRKAGVGPKYVRLNGKRAYRYRLSELVRFGTENEQG